MTSKLRTWSLTPSFTVALVLGVAPTAALAQSQSDDPDGGVISDTIDTDTPIDFPYTPPPDPGATAAAQSDGYETTAAGAATTYDDTGYGGSETTEVSYTDSSVDDVIADSYDDGYHPEAYREFEDALAAYGSWIEDPRFGKVWVPTSSIVGADFMPYYTNGNWVLSEYGWTWASAWSWGWAPFHYGRWVVSPGWGWSWVPGTMWGPAWVSWRTGGDYVGWAPLAPRGVVLAADLGRGSAWRFTTAAGLGAARLSCVPPQRLAGVWRGTAPLANDRLLSRGNWTVHVNAGPTRGVKTAPVQLATAAPHVLPKVRILPRPGTSLGTRPWARVLADAPAAPPSRQPPRTFPRHGNAIGTGPSPRPGLLGGPARGFAPTPASTFRTVPIRSWTPPPTRTFAAPAAPSTAVQAASAAPAPTTPTHMLRARPEPPALHSPEPAFRTTRPAFPSTSPSTFPDTGFSARPPTPASPPTATSFTGPASIYTPRVDRSPPPSMFQRPPTAQAVPTFQQPSPVRAEAPMPRVVREPSFNQPPRSFAPQNFATQPPRSFAPQNSAPQNFAPSPRSFAPTAQPVAPRPTHFGNPGPAGFGGAHRR